METTVTRTKDDEAALEAIRQGRTGPPERRRITEPAPFNPGLFFVPRPSALGRGIRPSFIYPSCPQCRRPCAGAVGLTGVRVEDPAQVHPALEKALATKGPVLVDVVTDPNVLSMPPKAMIQQAKGFALAMTKMAFTGELEDVTDSVMANRRYL